MRWLNMAETGLSRIGGAGGAGAQAASRWRAWARTPRAGLWLVLLALAVYLPGLRSIPPVDRDECRFAQASRQMFEAAVFPRAAPERVNPGFHDGGWAIPKVQDRERLNKPPLIYWLQVASAWAFTGGRPLEDAIWMYRVPSLLAALGTVLLTWRIGLRMMDPRAAWLGAALLAVAPMVVWDAHQARADSVMMFCTTAAMGCLWAIWKERGGLGWAAALWVAVAAGVMTKGFVTPMVVALAAAFLGVVWRRGGADAGGVRGFRWMRSLRPVLGGAILFAIVAPWVYAVALHLGGVGPYAQLVWSEFFVRGVAGSKEGHFAPPGTHTVLLAVLFWPGSLLTLAGFGRAWRLGRGAASPGRANWSARLTTRWAGRPAEAFMIAWIVPAWIVFELSPAKLPHYTMPMLPAVALLSARMVLAAEARGTVLKWANLLPWLAIGMLVGVPAILAALIIGWPIASAAGALVIAGLLVATSLSMFKGWSAANAQLCGLAAALIVFAAALPTIGASAPGAVSAAIIRRLRDIDPEGARPIASMHAEDSMVFGTRGRVERLGREAMAGWLAAHSEGLAVVRMDPSLEDEPGTHLVGAVKGVELGRPTWGWVILEKAK